MEKMLKKLTTVLCVVILTACSIAPTENPSQDTSQFKSDTEIGRVKFYV